MGVPTSTTLWCSSGLIWSPRWPPAAIISSMWLFSSRVTGSTSWNSSSMPSVNFSAMDANGRTVSARETRTLFLALMVWVAQAGLSAAQEGPTPPPRGPIELRDEWLPRRTA